MGEYTLKTNLAALEDAQANEYLMDFGQIIEKAFEHSDSRMRLLGNLLVLELGRGMKQSFRCVCGMRRGFSGTTWADASRRRIFRTLQTIILRGC